MTVPAHDQVHDQVVEQLTFSMDVECVADFLAADARTWDPYLRSCPGFLRKEVWQPVDSPGEVVVVIWWRSRDQWKCVTPDDVERLDREMGTAARQPVEREYTRVR